MSSLVRSRWAAIGAAVAVTLGAGGLISVNAENDTSSLVPITPERILDTRSADRVGSLDTAGASDPYRLKVAGTADIPAAGVTGVSLNVTAVETQANDFGGFVSVYPCASTSTTKPDVSNMNFGSGQTIANAVTVPVSADGYICLYVYGTAHLLVDANGYYTQTSATPGEQGPQGEAGPQGEQGPAGTNGPVDGSACTTAEGDVATVVSGFDSNGEFFAFCVSFPPATVSSLAGNFRASGSTDGTGSDAYFNGPNGVAVNEDGSVYVADTFNHTIRKITPAGVVTTLAGTAGATGSTDGTGSEARFYGPTGLAFDVNGNVYVTDYVNHTIRKITPAGLVTTLAGSAGVPGSTDGAGSEARFNNPTRPTVDVDGNVYVTDYVNHTIRKITPAGVVTTLAGTAGATGSTDGTGSEARFNGPLGITIDVIGNLYVTEFGNHTIRKITPAGVVTTLAGSAGVPGSTDGTGSEARFNGPKGLSVDAESNVYVADFGNHTIRKITPAGVVTTLAGSPPIDGYFNGPGPASRFSSPASVAVDSNGTLYVGDYLNHTIRKITPAD